MFFAGDGFKAFDGSNRRFRKLGLYDYDCCYQPDGRKNNPGISTPNDGYFIVERSCSCCSKCVVLESNRWYAANTHKVGDVVDCPDTPCVDSSINSATKCSFDVSDFCCNEDGSKVYLELFEEINPLP